MIHCASRMRRREDARILEPGNLLDMARLSFRVKFTTSFGDSAPPGCCLLFTEKRAFFYGMRLFIMKLYSIKWQAILFRIIILFPPRTYEQNAFYHRNSVALLIFRGDRNGGKRDGRYLEGQKIRLFQP